MTFLLDTNVVSELRKRVPDPAVTAWSQNQDFSMAYLSVITVREIEFGVLRKELQDPVQGSALRTWLERIISQDYAGRILPVDLEVARLAATLHVPQTRPERDSLIGATALAHGLTVVTRNVSDFEPMKVPTANPWSLST